MHLKQLTQDDRVHTLGGLAFSGGVSKDIDLDFSYFAMGTLLLDIPNQILSRKGVELGMDYHLIGGGSYLESKTGQADII